MSASLWSLEQDGSLLVFVHVSFQENWFRWSLQNKQSGVLPKLSRSEFNKLLSFVACVFVNMVVKLAIIIFSDLKTSSRSLITQSLLLRVPPYVPYQVHSCWICTRFWSTRDIIKSSLGMTRWRTAHLWCFSHLHHLNIFVLSFLSTFFQVWNVFLCVLIQCLFDLCYFMFSVTDVCSSTSFYSVQDSESLLQY